MANLLSEPQQTQILNLHQKGLSQRRIAQELGINRRSVSRYIRRLSKCTTILNTGSASGTAAPGVQTDTSPACLPGPECTTISNTGTLVGRHSACLAQGPVFRNLAIGAFAVLAQKHGSMFRALDFPNKGVFSTTRTCAEFYSESRSGFGDRFL